jgi:hypothetical protein
MNQNIRIFFVALLAFLPSFSLAAVSEVYHYKLSGYSAHAETVSTSGCVETQVGLFADQIEVVGGGTHVAVTIFRLDNCAGGELIDYTYASGVIAEGFEVTNNLGSASVVATLSGVRYYGSDLNTPVPAVVEVSTALSAVTKVQIVRTNENYKNKCGLFNYRAMVWNRDANVNALDVAIDGEEVNVGGDSYYQSRAWIGKAREGVLHIEKEEECVVID